MHLQSVSHVLLKKCQNILNNSEYFKHVYVFKHSFGNKKFIFLLYAIQSEKVQVLFVSKDTYDICITNPQKS